MKQENENLIINGDYKQEATYYKMRYVFVLKKLREIREAFQIIEPMLEDLDNEK